MRIIKNKQKIKTPCKYAHLYICLSYVNKSIQNSKLSAKIHTHTHTQIMKFGNFLVISCPKFLCSSSKFHAVVSEKLFTIIFGIWPKFWVKMGRNSQKSNEIGIPLTGNTFTQCVLITQCVLNTNKVSLLYPSKLVAWG